MEKILDLRFKKAIEIIFRCQDQIHSILEPLSTYKAIQFEINSAIHALQNALNEIKREHPVSINKLAIYHSSNVLLYSYILYCIIPSAYCNEIVVRPSTQVKEQTIKIHDLLQADLALPIKMSAISQRKFTENAHNAQAVVFTGRYENSVGLREHFNRSLFLFFGSGTNPMIAGKNIDIKQAVSAAIKGRLINSGQDCLCHNVFFVHESIASIFIEALILEVKKLRFGENNDKTADYGPIFYDGVVESVSAFLSKHANLCIYHNRIDINKKIIDPLIFVSKINDIVSLEEFFSPVFYLVTYSEDKQLEDWLLQPDQLRKAMALSIFGEVTLSSFITRYYSVFYNQVYFESESGNEPFGGFGVEASYAYYNKKAYSRPLLISREIKKFYGQANDKLNLDLLTG